LLSKTQYNIHKEDRMAELKKEAEALLAGKFEFDPDNPDICPPWWPRLMWQLHLKWPGHGPGPGPINYPPAINDIMAGLHIHTLSYLLADQSSAQQIRTATEQRLAQSVQNLSKAHEQAKKAA
jgi:hypothetical protein